MSDCQMTRQPSQPEEIIRLKNFVRCQTPGGCRMYSQGDECLCPLCDLDRLRQMIDDQAKTIAEQLEQLERPTEDMREICRRLGFDPTNHHNAAVCPYCTPNPTALELPRPEADNTGQ